MLGDTKEDLWDDVKNLVTTAAERKVIISTPLLREACSGRHNYPLSPMEILHSMANRSTSKSVREPKTDGDIIPPGLSLDPAQLAVAMRHALMSSFIIASRLDWVRGCAMPNRFEFSRVSEERSVQAYCMHFELRVDGASEGENPDVQTFSVNLVVTDKGALT